MHDWAITLTNELLEKAARFTDGQQHEGTSIKGPEKNQYRLCSVRRSELTELWLLGGFLLTF